MAVQSVTHIRFSLEISLYDFILWQECRLPVLQSQHLIHDLQNTKGFSQVYGLSIDFF